VPLAFAETPSCERLSTARAQAADRETWVTEAGGGGLPPYLQLKPGQGVSSQLVDVIRRYSVKLVQGLQAEKFRRFSVLAKLEDLRALPACWNGYGAAPINPEIIRAAEDLVHALPGDIISTPQVVPMTRGRLQFEWHSGDRSLELEFESPDSIHYLKWDSEAGVEEEDVLPITQHGKILDLLRWFSA